MSAWAVAGGVLAGLLLAMPAQAPSPAPALEVVGHDDLGARGLNAGLALAGDCAFVGSRGTGPVVIDDIADPAHPRTVGTLPGRPLTTAREVRAAPDRTLLVVMSYALASGGANRIDLYTWTTSCAHPIAAGSYDFGGRPPHEFYLWRQPGSPRTLLFVTMFSGGANDLQVLDVTDPGHPVLAATWSPPRGQLHSISLSGDGRRAFLSLWTGGLLVADVSSITGGAPNPEVTLLTPPAAALAPLPGGNVHSAVQLPGRDIVLITDERYPPACPYGPARLVDVSNPAQLRPLSTLSAPENDPAACRAAPRGTYTSHNPTIVGDLAFVTWYSSGLQVFDVSDPGHPQRLTEFRTAQGVTPGSVDPQLGFTPTMTWSYPIIRSGLIYVADINQGLFVLRYHGPHQEQVQGTTFLEGNSNVVAAAPSPAPAATPPATHVTPAHPRTVRTTTGLAMALVPLAILALVIAVLTLGVLGFIRLRAPRSR